MIKLKKRNLRSLDQQVKFLFQIYCIFISFKKICIFNQHSGSYSATFLFKKDRCQHNQHRSENVGGERSGSTH